MFKVTGGCYCRNISVEAHLSRPPESYGPRACDCNFCLKHGASYISDPAGSLNIYVKDHNLLGKYQQDGDGLAEFLHCRNCGVLIGVVYSEQGRLYGNFNSPAIDVDVHFGNKSVVSPKTLSDDEKIKRWKELWFQNVRIS